MLVARYQRAIQLALADVERAALGTEDKEAVESLPVAHLPGEAACAVRHLVRAEDLLILWARWFGKGHWFVAVGYDQNGIYTRDSSGWDTRYRTWSRLYGEVGFSGWVVGIAP